MEWSNKTKIIVMAIVLLAGIVSFAFFGSIYSSTEAYPNAIEILDEKSGNVLALATSSAAISTGLTMLPGDIAGPIANEMADLSSTLMLILSAIFLEKYLLALSGVVTFKILIPLAAIVFCIYIWFEKEALVKIAAKILILGLAIFLLVPVSTAATSFIDDAYGVSIAERIDEAKAVANEINENASDNENIVTKWLNSIKGGVQGVMTKVQTVFRSLIEIAALMIVTSCILPILIMAILLWTLNLLLGVNIPIDKIQSISKSGSKARLQFVKMKNGDE